MAETKPVREEYIGFLRPVIYFLGVKEELITPKHLGTLGLPVEEIVQRYNLFKVEWIEGDDVSSIVWTETVKVPEGQAFVPRITGYGTWTKRGGFYVDSERKRHFVIDAPVGVFGAAPGNPEMSKR